MRKSTGGKRGQNEGCISQRTDGRWEAKITMPNGERRSVYAKSRKAVDSKLDEAKRAIETAQWHVGRSGNQRVELFLDDWLRWCNERVGEGYAPTQLASGITRNDEELRPKTVTRYRQLINLHIKPQIGRLQLNELRPPAVRTMLMNIGRKGLNPITVQHCRSVLRNALEWGIEVGRVKFNAARASKKQQKTPRRKITALTLSGAHDILNAIKGDRLEFLYELTLALGVRQSEILGLQWTDIVAGKKGSAVHIVKGLHRNQGEYKFHPTKSEKSERVLHMHPTLVLKLEQHRQIQAEERARLESNGGEWQGDKWNLVFANEVGLPLSGYHVLRHFQKLLSLAGVRSMTYHQLRHGLATLLKTMDVDARTAQEILGHANLSTTLEIYTAIAPETVEDAMETAVNTIWGTQGVGLSSRLSSNPAVGATISKN